MSLFYIEIYILMSSFYIEIYILMSSFYIQEIYILMSSFYMQLTLEYVSVGTRNMFGGLDVGEAARAAYVVERIRSQAKV